MAERDELKRCFQRLSQGDLDALGRIYDLCSADIYGLALWRTRSPEEAADLLQDVFVRLSERRGDLPRVGNPKAYLLTMAHRMAIDRFRQRGRLRLASMEDCQLLAASGHSQERSTEARLASEALSKLPEDQREVVYLKQYCDLSFSEIGSIQGVPTFTAASRHRLGLKRLRRMLRTDRTS